MRRSPELLFSFLFFLLLLSPHSSLLSSALPLQALSLISLNPSFTDIAASLSSWEPTSPPPWCSWPGVTCSLSGDVTALDISGKNLTSLDVSALRSLRGTLVDLNLSRNILSGPLNPSAFFDLRRLRTLDISRNNFTSVFPPGISRLRHRLTFFDAYSNGFSGPLPPDLAELCSIEHLNLGGSFFSGEIPPVISDLRRLRHLHLAGNLLTGNLPRQLGSLPLLEHLEIGYNSYSGGIPPEIGHLGRLRYLDAAVSNLSGGIPPEIGNLSCLEQLFLFGNSFSGEIPGSVSALRSLQSLDLSDNRISGEIPPGLASISGLNLVALMNNYLSGGIPEGIGELPELRDLLLWNNSLSGELPRSLGSNGKLERLDVSSNQLSGEVPPGICAGGRLSRLILFSNRFAGGIPAGLAACSSLRRVRVEGNLLSGEIPAGIGELPELEYMDLSRNGLSGGIPGDLLNAAARRLEFLNVSENPLLGGELPAGSWAARRLQVFAASGCGLSGEIPGFRSGCASLYQVELERNRLTRNIPMDILRCRKLVVLRLGNNRLAGVIPPELAALPSITEVDLSENELTGDIPPAFDSCSTLEYLNVSFNRLTGMVPSSSSGAGVLRNLRPSSFAGNEGLCGDPVGRPCGNLTTTTWPPQRRSGRSSGAGAVAIVWVSAVAAAAVLAALFVGALRRAAAEEHWAAAVAPSPGRWKMTSFQRLCFTAEDVAARVAGAEVVGVGSMGTVYRAEMPNGEVIAVKKLCRRRKGAAAAGFPEAAELDVLGAVRHRNIVRLLGCCSNRETTMLLYEYMPNGSLDDLLHRRNVDVKGGAGVGDWPARFRIAVGVAAGISYLHHDCAPAIVHRDIKPSNILVDGEMEARVADFGVAKRLPESSSMSGSVAGSFGYIAPEYAAGATRVDEKSDVYSFGVVLMELASGRRPTDGGFGEGKGIVDWVREKVAKGEAGEVLDPVAVDGAGDGDEVFKEEMTAVLRLGMLCTSRNPADRPSMRDVASMLRQAAAAAAENIDGGESMREKIKTGELLRKLRGA